MNAKRLLVVPLLLAAGGLNGCVCWFMSETQSFEEALNYWVGSNYDKSGPFFEPSFVEGPRQLPGGDSEYVHRAGLDDRCLVAVVVDTETRNISGWRFLTDPALCRARSCGAW